MNLGGSQGNPNPGITQTRPYDFGTDAIERQRVSLGQAMMDADFEYGLQATKWQSFADIRKYPTFFEIPGTDFTISTVTSDGATPYSNITVTYNNVFSTPSNSGTFVSMFGLANPSKTADRAEGYFLLTSNNATNNTNSYTAKGVVPAGSIQTKLVYSKQVKVYNSGLMNINFSSFTTDGFSNIQVSTLNAHGILPGEPIQIVTSSFSNFFQGSFFVTAVPSYNTMNITSSTNFLTNNGNAFTANTLTGFGLSNTIQISSNILPAMAIISNVASGFVGNIISSNSSYVLGLSNIITFSNLQPNNSNVSNLAIGFLGNVGTVLFGNTYRVNIISFANTVLPLVGQNIMSNSGGVTFSTGNTVTSSTSNLIFGGDITLQTPSTLTANAAIFLGGSSLQIANVNAAYVATQLNVSYTTDTANNFPTTGIPVGSLVTFGAFPTTNIYSINVSSFANTVMPLNGQLINVSIGTSNYTGNTVTSSTSNLILKTPVTYPTNAYYVTANSAILSGGLNIANIFSTYVTGSLNVQYGTDTSNNFPKTFPTSLTVGSNVAVSLTVSNTQIYVNPYASVQHRPYDGGVLLSTLAPVHGSSVIRQSKKCFRYQSGKGILFSSGTLFAPNLDIASMSISGLSSSLTSNANGATGVSLFVSDPTLLAVGQNVSFSPTSVSSNVIISNINGSIVTFTYPGTFPGSTPTTITQNALSLSTTNFSNVSLPVVSNIGFLASNSISVSGVSSFLGTINSSSSTQLTANYGGLPYTGIPSGSAVTLTTPISNGLFSILTLINVAVSGDQSYFGPSTNVLINSSFQSNVISNVSTNSFIRLQSNTGSAPAYGGGFSNTAIISKTPVTTSANPFANVSVNNAVTITTSNIQINGVSGFVGNVAATGSSLSNIVITPVTWPVGGITGTYPIGPMGILLGISNTITFSNTMAVNANISNVQTGFSANIGSATAIGSLNTYALTNISSYPSSLFSNTSPFNNVTCNTGGVITSNLISSAFINLIFSSITQSLPSNTAVIVNGTQYANVASAYSSGSNVAVGIGSAINFPSVGIPLNSSVYFGGAQTGGSLISLGPTSIIGGISTTLTFSNTMAVNANISNVQTGFSANIGSATAIGSLNTYALTNISSYPSSLFSNTSPFNNVTCNTGGSVITSNLISNAFVNLIFASSLTQAVPANTAVIVNGTQYANVASAYSSGSNVAIGTDSAINFPASGLSGQVTFGQTGIYIGSNTVFSYSNIQIGNQQINAIEPITVNGVAVTGNIAITNSNISFPAYGFTGTVPTTVTVQPLSTLTLSSYQTFANFASTNFQTPGANVQINGTRLANIFAVPEVTSLTLISNASLPTPTTLSPYTTTTSRVQITPSANVTSTNGFSVGETVFFSANTNMTSNLGTVTLASIIPASATSNGILSFQYSGYLSSNIGVVLGETIAGSPVSITGTVPITVNVASLPFSSGQIVASYLGQNLGTVSISNTRTVSSNSQITLTYTGSFPPQGIPTGTVVTTCPPGSNIQIVTDVSHGLPTSGAKCSVRGVASSNINGINIGVSSVIDSFTLNVASQSTITSIPVNLGDQPRFVITNWHGSSVRAGIFEDPNGMFWEYDGQTLFVVRRQSTFQTAGTTWTVPQSQVLSGVLSGTTGTCTLIAAQTPAAGDTTILINVVGGHTVITNMYATIAGLGTVWVIGAPDYFQIQLGFIPAGANPPAISGTLNFVLPTTRFQDQLRVNDCFTLRGMTHKITSIQGQGILTFNPPYRGTTAISSSVGLKICKIKELRIPQSNFNRDTLDGNGPSGYKVDLSRMQMIGIQYTWYGAGFIDFMMRGPEGNWIYAHRIKNNNVNDEAYMRSGNLPVRYELSVECSPAVSALTTNIGSADTAISVVDPTNYFPSSGTLLVDNELISYTGISGSTFTGITRAAPLPYIINDTPRIFTGQASTTHLAGTSVNLISCTATPTLTHWGSSFITDGQFDNERGYYFNYSNTSIVLGASATACAFAVRLSPSVNNGFTGDIGSKELLNRSQLLLQKLEVTSNVNVQTIGYLNPNGIIFNPSLWQPVNNYGNGAQPSLVQYYPGNLITTVPLPGERILQTIVQGANQNNLDLTNLKEMSNSILSGNQPFPDGPDVLVIQVTNLSTTGPASIQVNLFWSEAQA